MKFAPKYAMQVGGMLHLWSSPDRSFGHSFLRLDFECEADPYPGILILTDQTYRSASAVAVRNLRKELPALLEKVNEDAVAYWWLERDQIELESVLSRLTERPIFADIR